MKLQVNSGTGIITLEVEPIKEPAARKKLKAFLEEYFDFYGLKEAGLFQGIRKTDYELQAAKICWFFGYKSVYDYACSTCIIRQHDNRKCNEAFCNSKNPDCKKYQAHLEPQKLQIDYCDMLTNDKWLN